MPFSSMAAEETQPYGRSPSRASRVVCETLNFEQKPSHGLRNSKKSQQKTGNEKLVWFAPVPSPLLSPGREKTLQFMKKKARQGSIFSFHSRAKGAIEAEEPTSPKVSCIGQVRANRKNKEAPAEISRKKTQQSKPGSASPARFFTSPGRQAKWGSLFGSRKEGSASPSPSGHGGGEVSCFGLPCDSPSVLGSDRRCGAFLARSLVLLQECGDVAESSNDEVLQMYSHAPGNQQENRNTLAAAVHANQCADGHANPCAHGLANPHVCGESQASSGVNYSVFQKKGPHTYEKPCDKNAHEKPYDRRKPITHVEPYNAYQHAADDVPSKKNHHEGPGGSKQKPTYEDLPPLHCGVSNKQNMKISLEVVPETWLRRNGEKLMPDGLSHLNCVTESRRGSSTEELQKIREEEATTPASSCDEACSCSSEAKECLKHQFSLEPSQAMYPESSNVEEKSIGFISVDDTTCKPVEAGNEKKNSIQHIRMDESTFTQHIPESQCTHMGALDEDKKQCRIFDSNDGAQDCNRQAHDLLHCEEHGTELDIINMGKQQFFLGSSELNQGHPISSKSCCDVEKKQNYGLALPQPVEKNLHFFDPDDDAKGVWGLCKGKKREAFPAQSFSALILVGYNLNEQPLSPKDARDKLASSEELLKGTFEVGRLSFHGTGRYLQLLKGDAEFIRSRSATSHRTVIRLQRSNSEPCRASC